jgi:hypothetical protein
MTGTGRRRWLIGVGVFVAVAVVLAGWLVLRDGDGDDGTDTTPTAELTWVTRLADLVQVDDANGTSPTVIGAALGELTSRLTAPQDYDTFRAQYDIGPLDMASQLGIALGAIASDVAPPSACGSRSSEMRAADTLFVLSVSSAAVAVIERDQDPAAVAALILPVAIEGDQRETIADQLAAGDIEAAAGAVEDQLGDDAAVQLVRALVEELTGVLASEDGADYLTSFLSSYNFTASVEFSGSDCD